MIILRMYIWRVYASIGGIYLYIFYGSFNSHKYTRSENFILYVQFLMQSNCVLHYISIVILQYEHNNSVVCLFTLNRYLNPNSTQAPIFDVNWFSDDVRLITYSSILFIVSIIKYSFFLSDILIFSNVSLL